MSAGRILIVEDDKDGRRSVEEAVRDAGFEAVATSSAEDALEQFAKQEFDVVLTDLVLPRQDGMAVLAKVRGMNDRVPVIIMTAYGSVSSAVQALKAGAYDYITKPLDLDDIQAKVRRAAETAGLRAEVKRLEKTVYEKYSARSMVAESPGMKEVLHQIESLAGGNATVLVQGESGTGKELVARALHADGKRAAGPFIAVNCGAFAETLLESEVFGHEKGAFTGATTQRKGAFERAHGGTLFLDEIGNAPASVQVKLLRILEERELIRVGGQETIPVDVRVISASNRDLGEMVEAGEFRKDLLYRLNVITINVPPLRERREDVRPLADRFIAQACEDHGKLITGVEPAFYSRLKQYDWPGNVRQLRNVVESAVVLSRKPVLGGEDARIDSAAGRPVNEIPSDMSLADIEKTALLQALERCKGNRTLAAEKLGISRRTIQRKIKEFQLPF